jgi:putative transposase
MAKPPRDHTSFGSDTNFVTANTWGKCPLFQTERMAGLFIDTLFRYRQQGKSLLHEFVVMPDHFHLLLTPVRVLLERAVQLSKGGFSYCVTKELASNLEVWSRGYVDHRIRDENDYRQHVEYVHQNPVEAGLVASAKEYPYSSAYPGFEVDACPQGLKPRFSRSA